MKCADAKFSIDFFAGFLISFFMYWILCKIWPVPGMNSHWLEVGDEVRNPSLVYGTAGYDIEQATRAVDGKDAYVTEAADSGSDKDVPAKAIS